MGYYDLMPDERKKVFAGMEAAVKEAYRNNKAGVLLQYFSDVDTFIRKNAALITGTLFNGRAELRANIYACIQILLANENEKVRQTAVNCLGEIGKTDAAALEALGGMLGDKHHSVRNACIGALKVMGEKKPVPTLAFARAHIHDPDPAVRREMAHGIELRGRKHPEEVLPILKELQFEENKTVKSMLVHVIGQISYKKGCLEKVLDTLAGWENKDLVREALSEIVKVHENYIKFAENSPGDAEKIILDRFGE